MYFAVNLYIVLHSLTPQKVFLPLFSRHQLTTYSTIMNNFEEPNEQRTQGGNQNPNQGGGSQTGNTGGGSQQTQGNPGGGKQAGGGQGNTGNPSNPGGGKQGGSQQGGGASRTDQGGKNNQGMNK